jgi:hypothetical protein
MAVVQCPDLGLKNLVRGEKGLSRRRERAKDQEQPNQNKGDQAER